MIKGEASTGSLHDLNRFAESPNNGKSRRIKVNAQSFEGQEELMRNSIGLADYDKKLAEL